MVEEYKIDRLKRICCVCQKEFQSGNKLISAVLENEQQQLVRQDYCPECWPKHPEVFSYWELKFPFREKPKLEDMEKVQKFFDKMLQKTEAQYDGVKFFTALVLLRKKRVRLHGTKTTDQGAMLRVEKIWDGESVDLVDPGINEEKLAEIRAQMEQLFDMEFSVQAV